MTRQQLLGVFDISGTYFDKAIRPLVADAHIRRVGRRCEYYCRGVIDSWADARANRRIAKIHTRRSLTDEQFAAELLLDGFCNGET